MLKKISLLFLSFVIVAFGQPVWSNWLGLVAAIAGFACFWHVLLAIPNAKERFCVAAGWYASVQIVQLSWFLSHPYLYIYGVFLFCAWLMGMQWGLMAIWIKPQTFNHLPRLLALAGFWILLEWSRLFILSGLPFNPIGLSLSSALYPLQLASIGGIYGLSFWVILTNLLFLRAWMQSSKWLLVILVACLPYGFGFGHLYFHQRAFEQYPNQLKVTLVQSALPIEENLSFQSAQEARQFVLNEWHHVLATLKKQVGEVVDLIVFPEYLVPYGTFHLVFPKHEVQSLLQELFGEVAWAFPPESSDETLFVSNAYIAQTIANFFQSHVVIGLEDSEYINQHKAVAYSSAFHFIPGSYERPPMRYEKQVLVPMGEYIPFEWCQKLAAQYGIQGSLTCGQGAKIFAGIVPFGVSICYEEIYGNLMRQNRQLGAELLLNLTNDGWYPNSRLPKVHFDHARLRTVENGIPLARACNTGVTGAIDSLGRVINTIEGDHADSMCLSIPLYHYSTFYTKWGDLPIIGLSCLFLLGGIVSRLFDSRGLNR